MGAHTDIVHQDGNLEPFVPNSLDDAVDGTRLGEILRNDHHVGAVFVSELFGELAKTLLTSSHYHHVLEAFAGELTSELAAESGRGARDQSGVSIDFWQFRHCNLPPTHPMG